ncbi:MAG: nicotinamide-nucleotide adenylyltransferase [Candidatus Thermoplasmatota archaeon]
MKGLFIGRFQPFHKGHLEAVRQILEECDSIIIGIGSAQEERTSVNPLSGGERISMIKRVIESRKIEAAELYPIPDLNCHPAWPYYVEAILPEFEKVYGNSEVVLDLFDNIGHETGKINQVEREQLSGTEIRRRIRENKEWKDLVPEEVVEYLGDIDMTHRVESKVDISSESEKRAAHLLTKKDKTISVAESCTGGLIANRLTSVPGSSNYFKAGFVTYSNEAKMDLLDVDKGVIKENGAVSPEVARQMAEGVRKNRGTKIGLASTGIAGPGGGSEEKPIGTVHLGLSTKEKTENRSFHFSGNRDDVKEQTSEKALRWIIELLED